MCDGEGEPLKCCLQRFIVEGPEPEPEPLKCRWRRFNVEEPVADSGRRFAVLGAAAQGAAQCRRRVGGGTKTSCFLRPVPRARAAEAALQIEVTSTPPRPKTNPITPAPASPIPPSIKDLLGSFLSPPKNRIIPTRAVAKPVMEVMAEAIRRPELPLEASTRNV